MIVIRVRLQENVSLAGLVNPSFEIGSSKYRGSIQ
jgi:hypothetical protein